MRKYYYSEDYTGKKHKIYMPEDRLAPWERGGVWDLVPWVALIGVVIAWVM